MLGQSKSAEMARALEAAENADDEGVRDERWEEVKGMLGKRKEDGESTLSLDDAQDKGLLGDQESM